MQVCFVIYCNSNNIYLATLSTHRKFLLSCILLFFFLFIDLKNVLIVYVPQECYVHLRNVILLALLVVCYHWLFELCNWNMGVIIMQFKYECNSNINPPSIYKRLVLFYLDFFFFNFFSIKNIWKSFWKKKINL